MNAKHALRIIEQSIAAAKSSFPDDEMKRARVFALLLSYELERCGEPLGECLAAMLNPAPTAATGAA